MRKLDNSNERFDQLLKSYESNLSGGYFDADEMEQLAEYYLRRMRVKDAKRAVEFGLKLHPNNIGLETCKIRILIEQDDFHTALLLVESLLAQYSFEIDLHLLQIDILLKTKQEQIAERNCHKLIEQHTEEKEGIYLDVAYVYLNNEYYQKALDFLLIGYMLNANNLNILFEIAFCYEKVNQVQNSIDTYQRILDIEPYSDEAWFNLGQVYYAERNFPKAIDSYEFATSINENDSMAWQLMAHAYYQNDNYKKAAEAYLMYAEQIEHKATPLLYVAECYEKMEDFDLALHYYSKVLDMQTSNTEALIGVGICYLEKEQFQKSITYFLQALELDSNLSETWVYLGEAYINTDDVEKGLNAYLTSLTLNENQPETLSSIGNLYLEREEFSLALRYYLASFELDSTTENIQLLVAMAYYGLKDYTLSNSYLQDALSTNENALTLFLEIYPDALDNISLTNNHKQ